MPPVSGTGKAGCKSPVSDKIILGLLGRGYFDHNNPNYGLKECRWLAEHILRWAGDSPVWLENDASGDSDVWAQYRVTAEEEWRKNLEAHEARQDEVEKMKANALEQAFGPNWRMNQTDAPEPQGHIIYDQMPLVSMPKIDIAEASKRRFNTEGAQVKRKPQARHA